MSKISSEPTDEPLLSGEPFSKYLLVGEIAQGGMGEVFLAVQQGLEGFSKVVVVKRVLRHLTANAEFTRMFIAEARLAARLEHSNIVKTYEFGEHQGQYFTVMEFLAGEDLGKVLYNFSLRAELMPVAMAVHIAAQLCNGLHFAHELTDHAGRPLGLVHRDVNPANIVITYTGEVKIIDFGVARVDTASIKTVTGMLKGKFAYMSPEYIQGQGCDHRADVFSVGIVLWEALTGRQLFTRESTAATMYAVMSDPIPLASKYRSDVPPELDAILARALSRAPEERYATADELRAALDDLAAALPKIDGRAIGRAMEALFGTIRAQAMSSIKQSRSMARNIALVMKRPASMPTSLSPVGWAPTVAAPTARRSRRSLGIAAALAAVVATAVVVSLSVMGRSSSPAASADAPSAHPAVAAVAPAALVHEPVAPVAPPPASVPPSVAAGSNAAADPAGKSDAVANPATKSDADSHADSKVESHADSQVETHADSKIESHAASKVVDHPPAASTTHAVAMKNPARHPPAHAIVAAGHDTKPTYVIGPPPVAGSGPVVSPHGVDSSAGGSPSGSTPPARDVSSPSIAPPPVTPPAATPPSVAPPSSTPPPSATKAPPPAVKAPPAVTTPDPAVAKSDPPAKQPALDVSATRAAVRAQIEPVMQCYERAKMDDGKLRGTVTVRITIAPSGSIANAQVASSTLSSPQVESCITREITHWQLPKPSGGAAVSLSYPFVFE